MKLTRSRLKEIIKEELQQAIEEKSQMEKTPIPAEVKRFMNKLMLIKN